MRELLDMVLSELRGSWRFRWIAIAAAWAVCLGGWTFVMSMQDEYQSEASVLFDMTSELSILLEKMTVNADLLSRVEMVREAMLGRPQLEQVARDTDLHLRVDEYSSIDSLVSGLRSRITITSNNTRGSNIYKIGYRDSDPQMAHAVVTRLLNNFVEQTLGANREDSARAQSFIREQIAELELELTAAEDRLAEFKRANVGRMPSEQGDYFSRLQAELSALEETNNEIRQAERRRDTLQQQLAGEQPSTENGPGQSEIDVRIDEYQKQLEALQLRFTDRHPDVIAVKETLEQLRSTKQQQLDALKQGDGTGIVSDNPVFQNIQIELARINVEIASLKEQRDTQNRKIQELRDLVDILPKVEADLARLNRDYDVTRAQYSSLLQRLEVAELSDSAEESESLKFQIIDPPLVPRSPSSPNRPLLLLAVFVFALGAGGGLAFVANQLKPVFTDPLSLQRVTGLPVLGAVSVLNSADRRRRQMGEVAGFAGALGSLALLFLAIFVFQDDLGQLIRSAI